jgi:hypothetical protein
MAICYTTAFLDISRDKWSLFRRTAEEYIDSFAQLLKMFNKSTNDCLIVYADSNHIEKIKKTVDNPNIETIPIFWIKPGDSKDSDLRTFSPLWNRLDEEIKVCHSFQYTNLMKSFNRLQFPEHNNPLYTLINHAKLDFVNNSIDLTNNKYSLYAWIDFGYAGRTPNNIPETPLNPALFDPSKVTYTLVSPLNENDNLLYYTLQYAPERICGAFFVGGGNAIKKYQQLYHQIHLNLLRKNVIDDDQHIALRCYFADPSLFHLENLGGWHRALTHYCL